MSGLAALLAGRTPPGVYRWHGAFDAVDVRHTVEHAGWRFAHVDGWHGETKKEFLAAVGEALGFPEWYGRNLDALADCLREVRAEESRGTLLLWDGWGPFARRDPTAFASALDALAERAATGRRGAFAVLLRGEGPEQPDLVSLD
ncbi:MAG TPA: barstar family protein [Nocardioides sp.]|uniref:barstar family protein n=1 Tax=Nocardioides sp. TaxID=35761 RepID=UPI002BAA48EF|nr:barstar family protein [Nocardioides sp.]HQR26900.1 barstar family protein [Nocardioides sp.]